MPCYDVAFETHTLESPVQDAVDCFFLLRPECVPLEEQVAHWLLAHPLSSATVPSETSFAATSLAVAARVSHIVDGIPIGDVQPPSGPTEEVAHDAYLHIQRVSDPSGGAFVRMMLAARLTLMKDVADAPVSVAGAVLDTIDGAFADVICGVLGSETIAEWRVNRWVTRGLAPLPLIRWVRGHHVFAALTQGLLFTLQTMERAIRASQPLHVRKWADLSIRLLEGSGAALQWTGDFPPDDYINIVRPSMMPPAAPVTLSGLMSADHRLLVRSMLELRPELDVLRQHEPGRHARLMAALAEAYDRHIHVCERFVGDRPSILTAERTDKSGARLLEQFKASRLKPFEGPRPTVPAMAPDTSVSTGAQAARTHVDGSPLAAPAESDWELI